MQNYHTKTQNLVIFPCTHEENNVAWQKNLPITSIEQSSTKDTEEIWPARVKFIGLHD